jgi:WD40 repeat protein
VWDVAAGRVAHRWREADGVNSLALSPDGQHLASTDGPVVRLWGLPSGKVVREFRGHRGDVDAVTLSPDGSALASGGWQDHTLRLWDVASGRERWQVKLPAPTGTNFGECPLVFTPDGKVLVSGSADGTNKAVYFWDTATGKELRRIERPASRLALSPDGRVLATAGMDRTVRLWDVASGKELRRLDTDATALAFAPDGHSLATGDVSGTVRLWELATGAERARFRGHQSGEVGKGAVAVGVSSLAFFPDGRRLLSGGGDTTALVWEVYRAPAERRPLEALWADLAKPEAASAYDALRGLLAVPGEATAFLKGRLAPAPAPDPQKVARLVAGLDSTSFEAREEATLELERLGEAALPALRRARTAGPSAEVRRRAAQLVERLDGPTPPGEVLRGLRAVEALEHIGSAEARRLLEEVAKGSPDARLTVEAKAALGRRP